MELLLHPHLRYNFTLLPSSLSFYFFQTFLSGTDLSNLARTGSQFCDAPIIIPFYNSVTVLRVFQNHVINGLLENNQSSGCVLPDLSDCAYLCTDVTHQLDLNSSGNQCKSCPAASSVLLKRVLL